MTSETIRVARRSGQAAVRSRALAAEAVTYPVLVGAVHWLVVQLAASITFRLGHLNPRPSPPYGQMPAPLTGWGQTFVEPLRVWDGLWYRLIAENGYGGFTIHTAAFWPLFPWLMRTGSRISGRSVDEVGYVIANLCFIGALILLYRLVALDFDRSLARRTLWALALFPTALFFSAVYTESLFLLLAVGALLAARTRHWLVAGVVGALAALTRSQGVLLLAPFAVLFLQQHRLMLRRWFPDAFFAALPALGAGIFGWTLGRVRGDRLAFVHVQGRNGWDRFAASPWETLRCGTTGCWTTIQRLSGPEPYHIRGAEWDWLSDLSRHPTWATLTSSAFRSKVSDSHTLEFVCTVLFLALAVVGLWSLPAHQSAYVWPALIIPLFGPSIVNPLMSMPRFGLVLFPVFVVLARICDRRRLGLPALLVSTVLLVLLTAQFAQWYWVS